MGYRLATLFGQSLHRIARERTAGIAVSRRRRCAKSLKTHSEDSSADPCTQAGMLACLRTAAVFGVDACPVQVEVDVSFGFPSFTMVGLPDISVRESRDRVRSAIRNSGFEFPPHRITVNLAPADVRKAGAAFDLP